MATNKKNKQDEKDWTKRFFDNPNAGRPTTAVSGRTTRSSAGSTPTKKAAPSTKRSTTGKNTGYSTAKNPARVQSGYNAKGQKVGSNGIVEGMSFAQWQANREKAAREAAAARMGELSDENKQALADYVYHNVDKDALWQQAEQQRADIVKALEQGADGKTDTAKTRSMLNHYNSTIGQLDSWYNTAFWDEGVYESTQKSLDDLVADYQDLLKMYEGQRDVYNEVQRTAANSANMQDVERAYAVMQNTLPGGMIYVPASSAGRQEMSGQAMETRLNDLEAKLLQTFSPEERRKMQNEIALLEGALEAQKWTDAKEAGAAARAGKTVSAGVKGYGASNANTAATLYEAGQTGRTARNEELLDQYWNELTQYSRELANMQMANQREPGRFSQAEIEIQEDIIRQAQTKYNAMRDVIKGDVQQGATQAAYEAADALQAESAMEQQLAKHGLGAVGQVLVDVGASGTQMLLDRATNAAIGLPGSYVPLLTRSFGSGAQQARQEGADLNEQLLTGGASAIKEAWTEQISNIALPFAKTYGVGSLDETIQHAIEATVDRLANTDAGARALGGALRVGASGLTEGLEELVGTVIESQLPRIYEGKLDSFRQVMEDSLYSFVVGAVSGLGGGVSGEVTQAAKDAVGHMLGGNDAMAQTNAVDQDSQVLMEAAMRARENAQEVSDDTFRSAWQTVRGYGENGLSLEQARSSSAAQSLTQEQLQAAYEDGVRRQNAAANKDAGQMQNTAQKGAQEVQDERNEHQSAQGGREQMLQAAERMGATLGEQGAAEFAKTIRSENIPAEQLEQSFEGYRALYEAKITGEAMTQKQEQMAAQLPQSLQEAAMKAGAADAARSAAQARASQNAGLIRDRVFRSAGVSESDARVLNSLGLLTGTEIRFADSIVDKATGQKANAKIEGNVMTIAVDSQMPWRAAAVHETVHRIRAVAPGAYSQLSQFVQTHMGSGLLQAEQAYATSYGENLDAVSEEIVADAFGTMLEDSTMLEQFATENRTAAQRLLDSLRALLDKVKALLAKNKNSPHLSQSDRQAYAALQGDLEQMEAVMANALETTKQKVQEAGQSQKNNVQKDVKFSIQYDARNRPFVVIEQDILDGVPKNQWVKTVKEMLAKKFPDGVKVGNNVIVINDKSRREMLFSEYTKWLARNDRSKYADKFRAAAYADEIILASRDYINEGLKHARKDNIRDFARGIVQLRVDKTSYTADVVVGKTSGGKLLLYDIVNLKETQIDEKNRHTVRPNQMESHRSGVSVNTSIRDAVSDVNSKKSLQSAAKARQELARMNQETQQQTLTEEQADQAETVRSARELLVDAMATTAQNEGERLMLQEYRARVQEYDQWEQSLAQQRDIMRRRKIRNSGVTRDEFVMAKNRALLLEQKLEEADQRLFNMEAARPLQKVLERTQERAKAEGKAEGKQTAERRTETEKYRKRVEKKAKQLVEWLAKNSDKEHVPENLKTALGELLAGLDFSSSRLRSGGDPTKRDLNWVKRLKAVSDILILEPTPAEGTDFYLDLPDGFARDISKETGKILDAMEQASQATEPIMKMGPEELKVLDYALSVLSTSIRKINKLVANAHYSSVVDAATDSMNELSALGEEKARGAIGKSIRSFFQWSNTTPYYAFQRFGSGGKAIFEGLMDGWDRFAFNTKKILDFAETAYMRKEVKSWGKEIKTITLSDGTTAKLTAAQAMSLYCLSKRQQAINHLMGGGMRVADFGERKNATSQKTAFHFAVEDLAKIPELLTMRQKEVADKLQEFMTKQGSEWGNRVSMERFGYRAFGEQNYFPIESHDVNMPMRDPQAAQNDLFRLLNLSATKSLTPKANNQLVVRDIFDVFANHMTDMAKYNALALPVLDAMKWYNYRVTTKSDSGALDTSGVKIALERAYGRDAEQYFSTFIRNLNGVKEGGRGDGFYAKMLSNYKVASVGANLRVAILQLTAYPRAAMELNPADLVRGLRGFNRRARADMLQHSGIAMWKQLGFYDTNIGAGVREQIKHGGGAANAIREASMILAEKADYWTWGALWSACRSEVQKRDKGLNGEALSKATAARFREVVYKTQVVDSTMTRSELMRDGGVFKSTTTAFMSEPTLSYNALLAAYDEHQQADRHYRTQRAALQESSRKDPAQKAENGRKMQELKQLHKETLAEKNRKIARAVAVYLASQTGAALVESIMDALRDDDEYADFWEKWTQKLLGEEGVAGRLSGNLLSDLLLHNKLPLVKDVFSLEGYENTRMDMEWLSNIWKTYEIWRETIQLARGELEEPTEVTYYGNMTTYGKIYQSLKAVSQMTGLPMGNLSRDAVAIWNNTIGAATGLTVKTYDSGEEKEIQYSVLDGYLTQEEAVQELMDKAGYSKADAEADAAAWIAQRDSEALGALSTNAAGKYLEFAKPAGLDEATYAALYKQAGKLESTKDENGETVDGESKKDKVIALIQEQELTAKQKDALYLALGYAESGLKGLPW